MNQPMTFTVERVVQSDHPAVILSGKFAGAVNADAWDGFKPKTLQIMRTTIASCLSWHVVRLRFEVEFRIEGHEYGSGAYAYLTEFGPLMRTGRDPDAHPSPERIESQVQDAAWDLLAACQELLRHAGEIPIEIKRTAYSAIHKATGEPFKP